jgi:Family of unknown function (DUF5681)
MSDYEIGYCKPPKHTRFKKGVCPNPRGRGKSEELPVAKIMNSVLNAPVEFHEQGKLKRASRLELLIKKSIAEALKGDVGSAGQLLTLRGLVAAMLASRDFKGIRRKRLPIFMLGADHAFQASFERQTPHSPPASSGHELARI